MWPSIGNAPPALPPCLSSTPPQDDIPKARLKLAQEMKKVVRRARAKGGMTLYLPTERLHGVALPVSIVASEPMKIPRVRPNSGPEAVLAALASETPGAKMRELDDTAALRSERDVPADAAQGIDITHRRGEYSVPIPDSTPDKYLAFFFSALIAPGSDPAFYDHPRGAVRRRDEYLPLELRLRTSCHCPRPNERDSSCQTAPSGAPTSAPRSTSTRMPTHTSGAIFISRSTDGLSRNGWTST
jgi:hypothetical protein